jgi:hypothetical protein
MVKLKSLNLFLEGEKKNKKGKTHNHFSSVEKRDTDITIESPPPSCPVAMITFIKPGTGPITGFPSGTRTVEHIS